MLLIEYGQPLPVSTNVRMEFPTSAKWHIGEPMPEITSGVVRFLADGDELCLILGSLQESGNGVLPIRLERKVDGWLGTLQFSRNGSVSVQRPTIEQVLGSLVLDNATKMGLEIKEVPLACA